MMLNGNIKIRRSVMDKLKSFFQNKVVMIVESVMLIASSVGLSIGGVSAEGITSMVSLGLAALSAVDAILTFIAALLKKKDA